MFLDSVRADSIPNVFASLQNNRRVCVTCKQNVYMLNHQSYFGCQYWTEAGQQYNYILLFVLV